MIQPYIFAMPCPDLCQDGFVLGPSNLLEVSGNVLRVVRPPASTIRAGLVVKGQEELLTEEFRRPLVVEDGDAFGDADFQVLDRHKDVQEVLGQLLGVVQNRFLRRQEVVQASRDGL